MTHTVPGTNLAPKTGRPTMEIAGRVSGRVSDTVSDTSLRELLEEVAELLEEVAGARQDFCV